MGPTGYLFVYVGPLFCPSRDNQNRLLTVALFPNGMSEVFSSGGRDFGAASVRASKFRFEMNSCQLCCWCSGYEIQIFFRLDIICKVYQPVERMEAN